ncbi:MAG: SLBB domain-containing protein [Balneolia bacterium]|nr:SLBB domain-containing protein [Balneolia bacterium]
MNSSFRCLLIFSITFLIYISGLQPELFAQQSRQNDDRRGGQQPQVRSQGINISGTDGPFYFIDPLGISLLMERMDSGDLIDTETYTLGSGDMVSIDLSGNMSGTFRGILISPQGRIVIPNVGAVTVDKMLIDEAEQAIQDLVNQRFIDTQVKLTLEHPRNIQIHIAGELVNPGFYRMPAQTRLAQALVPAVTEKDLSDRDILNANIPLELVLEGPHSFRNITIERGEETITADLVAYKLSGDLESNPLLMHGDVIRVKNKSQYAPQITISGSVVSPLLTEYRDDDTISKLVRMAGGYTFDASLGDIKVYRYSLSGIQTINLDQDSAESFELQPNDRIVVGYDDEKRYNQSARVSGEVNTPGTFPIVEGQTTVKDLLEMSGGFTADALPSATRLMRGRPWGNINALMRTSDQLLEGFEYLEMENALPNNEVFIDLMDPDQLSEIKLYNGDILTIPQNRNNIYVFGQVMNPGYYNIIESKGAFEYVASAGGFSLAADSDRTFIIKARNNGWYKPGETSIEPGDMIFVDRQPLESLALERQELFHRREIRNRNIQLIFSGLATITSVITAYVAIRR